MPRRFSLRTSSELAGLMILIVGLASCGPAATAPYTTVALAPTSAPSPTGTSPVAVSLTLSPTPSSSSPPPASVAVPAATAIPTSAPPAAPPAVRRGTFPLVPFGSRGAAGTVSVTADGTGFALTVSAAGLAPGSAHAVHLHAGSCQAAVFGRHLLILGTMVGNNAGFGALSSRVGLPFSPGRYVIVYANLSPATIIGCADLGSL